MHGNNNFPIHAKLKKKQNLFHITTINSGAKFNPRPAVHYQQGLLRHGRDQSEERHLHSLVHAYVSNLVIWERVRKRDSTTERDR